MSQQLLPKIQAVILDMDGVITDSARLHAKAWKQMFDGFLEQRVGANYTPLDQDKDYRRHIDGIARKDGVRAFLASRNLKLPEGTSDDGPAVDSVAGLAERKNDMLLNILDEEGVQVFPDTLEMIKKWKGEGKPLAVISASRNCQRILEAADVLDFFDVRVDGVTVHEKHLEGKPAPDIFLAALLELGTKKANTLIVEDAIAGIKAGKAAGFPCVIGVARNGEKGELLQAGADRVVKVLTELNYPD